MAAADGRYSAIVMDARTGEVLQQDMADEERYPASLTKMMTLYMLFEALDRGDLTLNTRLTASRHAASMPPSRLGLRRGDSITVEQAIRALVVQSANDVAVMVGERLGGSESRFASMMTSRAREMGLTDTHFENASGLPDPQQHTTARDMALLGQHLWRDFPARYAYFQTPSNSWRRSHGTNHNHLLGRVEGVDGIKTGYTRASGYNLVSSAERNGQRFIVVVMGGESAAARDSQVAYLLDGAFEQWAARSTNDVTYASLPTQRLDAALVPGANGGIQVQATTTFAPGAAPQGVVVQTLSGAHGPLGVLPPAQGAASEDEDSGSAQQAVAGAH
ncbi:MAG TPA: D-alanyl-D-alanine carboxypeptidase family protein [Caulobacterales bacterium]|nr:D-alanyl-D-alanine carboxypeptidase family protein [Caulobacterales bacterium]